MSTYRPVLSQHSFASTYPPYDKAPLSNTPILSIASSKKHSRLLGFRTLGPVSLVVLLSGGLATTLIVWLSTHAIVDSPPQTLATIWQTGYFLANEGTEVVNGLQRAKSDGLTISAATSHIISSTNSVISGIFAYRIAAQFLELSNGASRGGGTVQLPTPLQFALLLCLCHAGTLGTMGAAILYIIRKSTLNAPISPLLKQAVILVMFAYLLTHGVGLADFFLHKNTATVRYLLKNKELEQAPFGRTLNVSACDPPNRQPNAQPFDGSLPNAIQADGAYLGCFVGYRSWGDSASTDSDIREQGLISISNGPANTRSILGVTGTSLAVAGEVIDHFPRDELSAYSAQSIGTSVQCRAMPNCINFSGSPTKCTIPGNPMANATIQGIYSTVSYDAYGAIPNPFQFLFWFKMGSNEDFPLSFDDPTSPDAWFAPNGPIRNPSILTMCDVSINQVDFTWTNNSYTIDNTTPVSGFVAGAIFGPTRQTVAGSDLFGQVEFLSLTTPTISEFEKGLSNIMAKGMIARAAGLLMPSNTTNVATFDSLLITQYPTIPLFILLLLLYVYAILAISLMLAAMLTRSSHLTLSQESGGTEDVSMLALAQRSIVSPLSLIAAMFDRNGEMNGQTGGQYNAAASRARASAALDDTALFDASENAPLNPPRVTIGLGGDSAQPRFGLWLADDGQKSQPSAYRQGHSQISA